MTSRPVLSSIEGMPVTIPSATLRTMSEAERRKVLDDAFASAAGGLGAYLAVLEARLRVYEQRYELPSSQLSEAVRRKVFPETAEISDWLFWAELRSQLAGEARA